MRNVWNVPTTNADHIKTRKKSTTKGSHCSWLPLVTLKRALVLSVPRGVSTNWEESLKATIYLGGRADGWSPLLWKKIRGKSG